MKKALIIGPDPKDEYLGGVATHVRTISQLSIFKNATVLDIGTLSSLNLKRALLMIKNLIIFRSFVNNGHYTHIFFNTSIFSTSLLKLLILLTLIYDNKNIVKYVFFHGGDFHAVKLFSYNLPHKLSLSLFKKVSSFFFLTEEQQSGFKTLFPSCQSERYYNFSSHSTTRLPRHNLKPLVFLFVGRIVREKGIFEILAAVDRLVNASFSDFHVNLVGDGVDLLEFKQSIKPTLTKFFSFKGYLKGAELDKAYLESNVLLLPSYAEAFPYVIIEAMQAGIPIISTPFGAMGEIIKDEITGYIVKSKDANSLADAMKRILDDRAKLLEMSQRCHDYFKERMSFMAAETFYSSLFKDAI